MVKSENGVVEFNGKSTVVCAEVDMAVNHLMVLITEKYGVDMALEVLAEITKSAKEAIEKEVLQNG